MPASSLGSFAEVRASALRDPLAGTPYRFLRKLGQGAHGLVVEAEQIALRRVVVVKLLHERCAGRDEIADRLRLEAQAVAALAPLTPHVASVLELGRTPDDRPYIVMERLDGRSLREELGERGALPVAEAVDITAQILAGLAVAHEAGIVHRDVKPENVFLCRGQGRERVVKVIDFGLAKLLKPSTRLGPSPLAKPTDEGVLLGTPKYFSPEQARGLPATPASDIYSAGVVLYTMLTGGPLFPHCTNVYHLVRAHLTESPPRPSLRAPGPIPEPIEAALSKALAKTPEERYASARAFRAALLAVLPPLVPMAPLPVAPPPSPLPAPRPSVEDEDPASTASTLPLPRSRRRRSRLVDALAAAALATATLATSTALGALAFVVTRGLHAAPLEEASSRPAACEESPRAPPTLLLPEVAAPSPSPALVDPSRPRPVASRRVAATPSASVSAARVPPAPPVWSAPPVTAPHRVFGADR